LLDNFVDLVSNYKTKYKVSISSTIRRLKTIITISKVIVSTSLVDIVVLVLLPKKREQSSKTIENALMFKKRDRLSKIKIVTNSKKSNNV